MSSSNSTLETGPYYEIFTLPTGGEAGGSPSGTEAYYSFDYANIHFVVLNSNDVDRGITGDMLIWLQLDLAATDKDWIIAVWHHPPYTKGHQDSHDPSDSNGRLFDMRQDVVPILDDGTVLLVRQYRYAAQATFLEIPAGKLDYAGEAPLAVAARELAEETGYQAGRLEPLASLFPGIGYSNEVIHFFLGRDLVAGDAAPDADEFLEIVHMPFAEAVRRARLGEFRDMKTAVGLLMAEAAQRTAD